MSPHGFTTTTTVTTTTTRSSRPRLIDIAVTTPPAELPVTLVEARDWLRVDGTDQDDVISALLAAVTNWAENFTRRAFIVRTQVSIFAAFPRVRSDFYMPSPPTQSVSSIAYVDSAGADQVFDGANFTVEQLFGLLRIKPDSDDWPQDAHSVTVTHLAGVADAAAVDEQIKTGIKVALAQLFEVRGDQVVGTIVSSAQTKASEAILAPFRVFLT